MFNPPNPNATGMGFNQQQYGAPPQQPIAHSQQPSIGASLMDQEAVALNPGLQGKKKKKKKAKAKINPNAFLESEG